MKNRQKEKKEPEELVMLRKGLAIVEGHPLFSRLIEDYSIVKSRDIGNHTAALVYSDGRIRLNSEYRLSPSEWAYVIAHCILHRSFGHFDADTMPGYEISDSIDKKVWKPDCDKGLWNLACDIYVTKFLEDIKFGSSCNPPLSAHYNGPVSDERSIYQFLVDNHYRSDQQWFGTGAEDKPDMIGLDQPHTYINGERSVFVARFAYALASSVSSAVSAVSNAPESYLNKNAAEKAASWFLCRYPLLGGLASSFHIIYNYDVCYKYEVSIAAVDVSCAEIYINPAAGLTNEELKFVLAHEYLHAGLQHDERCQGRDHYLWNVACDYVINGWLKQMDIGVMPEKGILYDEQFDNVSAEEVYDRIVSDFKAFSKMETLRGYHKGDFFGWSEWGFSDSGKAMGLDEFYKNALQNGLEYHRSSGRGLIPAGLEQEIRALSMPPVPWDVQLARWFDIHFSPIERKRTYARPSRRQGSTPDIPRPRMIVQNKLESERTFGVVIDTSGSMSAKQIGYALGAVASYSEAKEVPYARVVFCDADAYDAGYIAPGDIAGRVIVKGRGGTVLQPGVDKLLKAVDFPKDGPILIITDGMIEKGLRISREHAFILPAGSRLPFKAQGEVFYAKELKEVAE